MYYLRQEQHITILSFFVCVIAHYKFQKDQNKSIAEYYSFWCFPFPSIIKFFYTHAETKHAQPLKGES